MNQTTVTGCNKFVTRSTSKLTSYSLKLLIETHYLPCVAYFSLLTKYDQILLESKEYYVKQTYRNRTYINTTHGRDCLIIPLTGKHGKAVITDVRIDYSHKWMNNHWRSITSAYGKAPFFEFYADELRQTIFRQFDLLYDLNHALLTLCLKWLRLNVDIEETLTYKTDYVADVDDRRSSLNPKDTTFTNQFFKAVPYQQVFGNSFAANLSIVDVIFCCGPEAGSIVKASSNSE